MQKLRLNVHPKPGHFFKENDGSIQKSDSWAGLIKRVVRYRALNKLPPGDPLREITLQAGARDSSSVYNDDPVTRIQTKRASAKGRVLTWFSELRKRKTVLLFGDYENMTARANICAACPQNTELPGGCSSCRKVVQAMRDKVLVGRPSDGRIHACAILGVDLPTAVWIDEPTVDNPNLPPPCWRRKL